MLFVPGWHSDFAVAATTRLFASGKYCVQAPDNSPLLPALSGSQYRARPLLQGQAGTCHETSPAQFFSMSATALGYREFAACRRLIGFVGEAIIHGGNQANGGSPTANIMGMTNQSGQGIGVAHENLCPYTDDPAILAQRPPQDVWDDAKATHLIAPVIVPPTFDAICRSVANHQYVCNGFLAPNTLESGQAFISDYSSILGGHSILIIGYIQPGVIDPFGWLQFEGWWGNLYGTLPPAVAAKVPGYKPVTPAKTSDCWLRWDLYSHLLSLDTYAEHISAVDISGLQGGNVTPAPGFDPTSVFPI